MRKKSESRKPKAEARNPKPESDDPLEGLMVATDWQEATAREIQNPKSKT